MARTPIPKEYLQAIARYGPSVAGVAKQYGISGEALLAKVLQGESGFQQGRTSSAGAKGPAQFTAGSRATAMQKFGVDPWADVDQAVHGEALHLRGKINGSPGLEGYNPGMASYPQYILGQRVGDVRGAIGRRGGGAGAAVGGGPVPPAVAPAPSSPSSTVEPGGTGLAGMVAERMAQQRPQPAPSSGLQAPSFAARPAVAGGGQVPMSSPPARQASIADLVAQASQMQGDVGSVPPAPPVAAAAPGAAPAHAHSGGRVRFAQGVPSKVQPVLADFLAGLAGRTRGGITVGTTTNHNRLVAGTNRVSEHFTGNAADLPAKGRAGDLIAAHALVQAGVPWKRAVAMARQGSASAPGGVWDIPQPGGGRVQVIWKSMAGGNHFNHVHVGAH
jgi:hypothetical protein